MRIRSVRIGLALAMGVAAMQITAAAECPSLETAKAANNYRVASQAIPRTFASCVSNQIESFPTTGADLDAWMKFYEATNGVFRKLYMKEPVGTEARLGYSADELALRVKYRLAVASRMSEPDVSADEVKRLRGQYAVGVDTEYDLIYRRTADGNDTMESAHKLLVSLDPVHLLDQTGMRWAEVVRTCPIWRPSLGVTATATFCRSCSAEFEKVRMKLGSWLVGKSVLEVGSTTKMLQVQEAEIAQSCKG